MSTDLPDMHEMEDGEHWRGLSVDQLLDAIAEQIDPQRDGSLVDQDYVRSMVTDVVHTVTEDVFDRAEDMAHCGKPDG